jgi:hypothetical protein
MTETRTITAVFADRAIAERAIDRLRGVGIPDRCIEAHRAEEGEAQAEAGPAGGIFAAISEFFMPGPHRAGYAGEAEHRATVVLATGISEELSARAIEVLDEDALDVHEERDPDPAADEGAVGTAGGFGRATGEIDRLTGERIGAPHELDPDGTAPRRRTPS